LAVSGVFDLTPLVHVSMNEDLRLTPDEARAVSPLFWPLPSGRALDAWCGALESGEFRRQNRIIAEAWGKASADTAAREVAGANHFTVIDPLAEPDSEMVGRIVQLASRMHAPA
jgi:arylformamidase